MVVNPGKNTFDQPLHTEAVVLESAGRRADERSASAAAALFGRLVGKAYLQRRDAHEGIRVEIAGTQFVTVTNASGQYVLPNVPTGNYSVVYSREGYRAFTLTNVQVAAGKETPLEEVALEYTATPVRPAVSTSAETPSAQLAPTDQPGSGVISGIVEATDADGNAITDYSRILVAINDSSLTAEPDDEGRFRFPNLAPGLYTVLATLDKGDPVKTPADLTTEDSVTLKIKIGEKSVEAGKGRIIGKVVLPGIDDAPLADSSGVRIALAGTQMSATSGEDGTFKLEEVPSGTINVVVTKEGFEDLKEEGLELAAGRTLDLGELRLEPKRDYPRVLSTIPPNGTSNVTVNLELYLQIKFSKKMNPESVKDALALQPSPNARLFIGKGTHQLADDDTAVVVMSGADPSKPILFGTQYRLTIAKTASDLDGLGMKNDFSMSFKTGAPGIVATRPADGERDVMLDQLDFPVIIHFNTKLKPETVIARNFKIKPDPRSSINMSYSHDNRNGWTSVRLSTLWKQDTDYSITVDHDVRALNGQRLGNTPYTFRFRSGRYEIIAPTLQELR
jgi:hypothetical protein